MPTAFFLFFMEKTICSVYFSFVHQPAAFCCLFAMHSKSPTPRLGSSVPASGGPSSWRARSFWGGPLWSPPEASLSPSMKRIVRLLRQQHENDIRRFGVDTHARVPWMAYPYPPGACKERQPWPSAFKPQTRDPWELVYTPDGVTPRWRGGPAAPKTDRRVSGSSRFEYTAGSLFSEQSLRKHYRKRQQTESPFHFWWWSSCC